MDLNTLGWNQHFDRHFRSFHDQGLFPARVVREQRRSYLLLAEAGEFQGRVTGRMQYHSAGRASFPAVGDWVAAAGRPEGGKAIIHAVLPRRTSFSRKAVLSGGMPDGGGVTDEQVLAANVDTVFLVSGLDNDFNLRRIERYVTVAWDSGAAPVIVLNKIDLCPEVAERVDDTETVAMGIPVLPVSATTQAGVSALHEYLTPGETVAFLGSSGVGKSSLINCLLGESRIEVQAVRQDDSKGRHTTTTRDLYVLPSGGLVIDTPGLREIQMWDDEEGLSRAFQDVEELFQHCRFRDCRHESEPGCAVTQALQDGSLDADRYRSYLKLRKELEFLAIRRDKKKLRQADRAFGKMIAKHLKGMKNNKR